MKIAIIGAGAIGGYVGAKLALAGEDVTFIVRGANLEAISARGIKLIDNDGTEHVATSVKAFDDYAAAGVQELVILALKAHQVDAVADQIGHLMGPDTVVVTMQKTLRLLIPLQPLKKTSNSLFTLKSPARTSRRAFV